MRSNFVVSDAIYVEIIRLSTFNKTATLSETSIFEGGFLLGKHLSYNKRSEISSLERLVITNCSISFLKKDNFMNSHFVNSTV